MEVLETGKYYHIYNRGINSCDLFIEEDNFSHFLNLYEKYIHPIADTFAWVLMPNHFHFLVRIKDNICYKYSNADRSDDAVRFDQIKWETKNLSASKGSDSVKIPKPHLHFSHLFNSYTRYINKRNKRHGSLFERPFKRKLIDNEKYFQQLVLYIHNNPIHHGFCEHPIEYGWSSYITCISNKLTKLKRNRTVEWFEDLENFKQMHKKAVEVMQIEEWLGI
ncbi:hypothetical protein [Marinifilum sp. D737]|uniref:hypothetical protein n=1 Tax=Marinifilum sp. D737 TaxID=2969628 RepID=UPI0022742E19|nr:hypothetical protein [Marinifilum sp. D737]MCY1633934.1 hypothetical protein [Marinifilum sp. D737]